VRAAAKVPNSDSGAPEETPFAHHRLFARVLDIILSSAPRLSIIRRSRRARASRVLVAEFVRRMPLANVHRVSSRRRVATRELDASPGEWL